jgi:hypothetical protein
MILSLIPVFNMNITAASTFQVPEGLTGGRTDHADSVPQRHRPGVRFEIDPRPGRKLPWGNFKASLARPGF